MRGDCGILYRVPHRHNGIYNCIATGSPYSALFPVKRGVSEIQIPDSSYVSQRGDRDTEFVWPGLELRVQEAGAPLSINERIWGLS